MFNARIVGQFPRSFLMPFLSVLLVAALTGCAYQPTVTPVATSAVMTKVRQDTLSADQALQLLNQGNLRFVAGQMQPRILPAQVRATGRDGQFPLASVVSCIDSRADPALVFDQGIGDLFVARVAGNVINPDVLGSLEYGSAVAGTKLIVILGHTHCGAVKGACDGVALGNLTQLLEKLRPAVKATPNTNGTDRSSKNSDFVDAVAKTHVDLSVKELLAKSVVLRQLVEQGKVKVVGAMLDVETGKVTFE